MQINVTFRGKSIIINDIAPFVAEQKRLEAKLGNIMHDFDPKNPSVLRHRESEIVTLYNQIIEISDIVQQWRDAEEAALGPIRDANIMTVWEEWLKWQAEDYANAARTQKPQEKSG
ncbi:hypothetical protein [Sphingomonas sp. 22176]|uniref:hypothetical protein n=1 Tax=Sphingomonas sp. 22176 TaxID=3453884 RepID=UPI003F87DB6E